MTIASTGHKGEASASATGQFTVPITGTTAGTALVLVASAWKSGGGPTTIAVTDTAGNTWDPLFTVKVNGDASLGIFYVKNNAGSGSITITVNPSGGGAGDTNDMWAGVEEFSGLDTSSPISGTPATNSGTGTSGSSGTTTPADANCLVVTGVDFDSSASLTASGAPWVLSNENDLSIGDVGQPGSFVYQILTGGSGSGISHTWTFGASGPFAAGIGALKPAGAGGGVTVAPPAGSLTLTGQVPTVNVTANQLISVPAGSLTLSGKIPTVLTPVSIAVPAGSLSLTANAPAVITTANQLIAVPAGSVTLTGLVPTVTASGGISVPAGSLSLTPFAPTVITTANVTVAVPAGTLTLAASAPQVLTPVLVSPPAGSLTLTALAPIVNITTNVLIDVPAGTLSLTALAPTVIGEVVIPDIAFSGGFLYEYEREQLRRRRKRREEQEREEAARNLQDKVDAEIALLLARQEEQDERRAELDRLQRLVRDHSREQLALSNRAKVAYVRALTQANFSAMEALDRELQRMLEEEEIAALMLLLND